MSFSFVRGFIHSAFGPLNPNHLPKIFPFPVRALDNMASRGEEDKGINKGGKGEIPWNRGWTSSSTSTGIAVKWMTHHDWEFHSLGQLLKWFKSMQVPTQLR